MFAGVPVDEVIKVMHINGPTSIGQLIKALDFYNIKHADRNVRLSKESYNFWSSNFDSTYASIYTLGGTLEQLNADNKDLTINCFIDVPEEYWICVNILDNKSRTF